MSESLVSRVELRQWQFHEALVIRGLDTHIPGGGRMCPHSVSMTYAYSQGAWRLYEWDLGGPLLDREDEIIEDSDVAIDGDYLNVYGAVDPDSEDEARYALPTPCWILQLAAERARLLPVPVFVEGAE